MVVDATLLEGERDDFISEVRSELPLWLARSAIPIGDPVAALTDLLRFDVQDIRRVHAVHVCLSEPVRRFVVALPAALRTPRPASDRPREVSHAVRGPIDWPATVRLHAGGQPGVYATRPRRRTFDTPEYRALRWTLRRLEEALSLAAMPAADDAIEDHNSSIAGQLATVRRAVLVARRVEWLRDVPPERPIARVRQRLARSRNAFLRAALAPTVERLLHSDTLDPSALAALLCQRYFVPDRDWRLFEVVVLIRIDRALTAVCAGHVRRRLFSESGAVAHYRLGDGSDVVLRQQSWPPGTGAVSRRQITATRHGLSVLPSRPDVIVQRRLGVVRDFVVLELKASRQEGTLGDGLSQLLGYLHERPDLFDRQPAGWLVALPFDELMPTLAEADEPLWIVDATRVADAIVSRLLESQPL